MVSISPKDIYRSGETVEMKFIFFLYSDFCLYCCSLAASWRAFVPVHAVTPSLGHSRDLLSVSV